MREGQDKGQSSYGLVRARLIQHSTTDQRHWRHLCSQAHFTRTMT